MRRNHVRLVSATGIVSGETMSVTGESNSRAVRIDFDNNKVVCLNHQQINGGLSERGLLLDDGMSTGTFREIQFEGVQVSIQRLSTNRPRIIVTETPSPTIEMLFLLEGKADESFGKHICQIAHNQHNLFFKSSFKGNHNLNGSNCRVVSIQLSRKFYERFIDEAAGSLQNIFAGSDHGEACLRLSKQNLPITPEMKAIVHAIMSNNRTGYMKRLLLESKAIELFMLQVEQAEVANSRKSTAFKKEDIDRIYEARSYVEQNMLQEFGLMDVCRSVGLNDFKLKKGFRELFGTTVFSYLNEIKMDYAKRLLLDEKKTVYETAMILGYSEPHHFSSAFKKKFSYLPGELK